MKKLLLASALLIAGFVSQAADVTLGMFPKVTSVHALTNYIVMVMGNSANAPYRLINPSNFLSILHSQSNWVRLAPGSNITLVTNGPVVTISSSGGGGGGNDFNEDQFDDSGPLVAIKPNVLITNVGAHGISATGNVFFVSEELDNTFISLMPSNFFVGPVTINHILEPSSLHVLGSSIFDSVLNQFGGITVVGAAEFQSGLTAGGSGVGFISLDDSDQSHHATISAPSTITTNIHFELVSRPVTGLSHWTLSGETNLSQTIIPTWDGSYVPPFWDAPAQPAATRYATLDYDGWLADYQALSNAYPDYVSIASLGADESGTLELMEIRFTPPNPRSKALVTTGIHGDEYVMVNAVQRFATNLVTAWESSDALTWFRWNVDLRIVFGNPWGFEHNPKQRKNVNGIDIARNFSWRWSGYTPSNTNQSKGAAPFDQAETAILAQWILDNIDATCIVDAHDARENGGFAPFTHVPPDPSLPFDQAPIMKVLRWQFGSSNAFALPPNDYPTPVNWAVSNDIAGITVELATNYAAVTYASADHVSLGTKQFGNILIQMAAGQKPSVSGSTSPRAEVFKYYRSDSGVYHLSATLLTPLTNWTRSVDIVGRGFLILNYEAVLQSTNEITCNVGFSVALSRGSGLDGLPSYFTNLTFGGLGYTNAMEALGTIPAGGVATNANGVTRVTLSRTEMIPLEANGSTPLVITPLARVTQGRSIVVQSVDIEAMWIESAAPSRFKLRQAKDGAATSDAYPPAQ